MKNIVISVIVVIIMSVMFAVANNRTHKYFPKASVKPCNEIYSGDWHTANIYDISITNGMFCYDDIECLPSVTLRNAIIKIINDNSTAYPSDIAIEVKYISSEDIFIANIIDIVL